MCSTGQNSGGRKAPIKLHLLLDHDGYLPSFAVETEGNTSEIKVARTLRFAPGTILAIDRGYIDYEWFRELTQEEVYFVTRMKEKAVYEVREELQVPQNSNVVCDQIICFPRLAREGEEPVLFRRVEIWDAEKQEAIVFLSNLLAFGATTIAAIYRDRWEVALSYQLRRLFAMRLNFNSGAQSECAVSCGPLEHGCSGHRLQRPPDTNRERSFAPYQTAPGLYSLRSASPACAVGHRPHCVQLS